MRETHSDQDLHTAQFRVDCVFDQFLERDLVRADEFLAQLQQGSRFEIEAHWPLTVCR